MRAQLRPADTVLIARQIASTPFIEDVRALSEPFAAASEETIQAILDEAARFAVEFLEPLNEQGDRLGCTLVDGRVKTPPLQAPAWRAYAEAGWLTMDLPLEYGGQELPQFLVAAVQEVLDRSCTAFGMMPVPSRSAARLLGAFAPDDIRQEWLPRLSSGEWGATICISEVGAGSDVPRLRTTAERDGETWRVTGEKQWISFGDQDITARIGHCLLARTAGVKGLSLFLVPDHFDGERNGVTVRRLEEKLGLHLSPTCALGFENSNAILLGEEGRGLAQMFVMIALMRTAVGVQGVAAASGAFDAAFAYAGERRQGGRGAEPMMIRDHPDVRRMLLTMASKGDVLRGFGLALTMMVDLARLDPVPERRGEFDGMVQWMLPMLKTVGGEIGFDVASEAIQVFGGAGFTREWPVEQMLRDARVLTIYEGTTGMQAQDILHRRLWRDAGRAQALFLQMARSDAGAGSAVASEELAEVYRLLEESADWLSARQDQPVDADAGATPFLRLSALAVMGWTAARMAAIIGTDAASRRLRASGTYFLTGIADRARCQGSEIRNGGEAIALFGEIGA